MPLPSREECSVFVATVQASAVRQLVEVLKDVLHDVMLVFSADGITLSAMDSAKCALVAMKLEASAFEVFSVPATVSCGVSLAHLAKCVKTASATDTITLAQRAASPNELYIRIENTAASTNTEFSLKLLAVDSDIVHPPAMDFSFSTTLPSVFLSRLVRDMSAIGEYLEIDAADDKLSFTVRGDFASQTTQIGAAAPPPSPAPGEDGEVKMAEPIHESFPLKYVCLFCRASALSTSATLNLRAGYPLVMSFNVASLGTLRFVLAPRA